jgi:hypothetical protein
MSVRIDDRGDDPCLSDYRSTHVEIDGLHNFAGAVDAEVDGNFQPHTTHCSPQRPGRHVAAFQEPSRWRLPRLRRQPHGLDEADERRRLGERSSPSSA